MYAKRKTQEESEELGLLRNWRIECYRSQATTSITHIDQHILAHTWVNQGQRKSKWNTSRKWNVENSFLRSVSICRCWYWGKF